MEKPKGDLDGKMESGEKRRNWKNETKERMGKIREK